MAVGGVKEEHLDRKRWLTSLTPPPPKNPPGWERGGGGGSGLDFSSPLYDYFCYMLACEMVFAGAQTAHTHSQIRCDTQHNCGAAGQALSAVTHHARMRLTTGRAAPRTTGKVLVLAAASTGSVLLHFCLMSVMRLSSRLTPVCTEAAAE